MEIVISIRSEYLNKIRDGEKKWELRKKLPVDKISSGQINKIWVWETKPISKIVDYIEISELKQEKPSCLWKKYGKDFGVDKKFYDEYYANSTYALAIGINKWVEGIQPVLNPTKPTIYAPQGYVYLH